MNNPISLCPRLSLALLIGVSFANAQDWDREPVAGRLGPIDGSGVDGIPNNGDDYNGMNNSPDLRGPDGEPGTADDLHLYVFGTGAGGGGCFTNNTPNCVGASGSKSAEWSLVQIPHPGRCEVTSILTNTSDGEPGCPEPGCISQWSSPRLPVLEAAVRAALDLAPMDSVTATDGPGPNANCRLVTARYSMQWNPETPAEPAMIFEVEEPEQQREEKRKQPEKAAPAKAD